MTAGSMAVPPSAGTPIRRLAHNPAAAPNRSSPESESQVNRGRDELRRVATLCQCWRETCARVMRRPMAARYSSTERPARPASRFANGWVRAIFRCCISPIRNARIRRASQALNEADLVILCLRTRRPAKRCADREPAVRVIDASTAHRVATAGFYGLPSWKPINAPRSRRKRVSNPGCWPTGFLALVRR